MHSLTHLYPLISHSFNSHYFHPLIHVHIHLHGLISCRPPSNTPIPIPLIYSSDSRHFLTHLHPPPSSSPSTPGTLGEFNKRFNAPIPSHLTVSHPPIHPSTNPLTHSPIHPSIHPSIHPPIHPSTIPPTNPSTITSHNSHNLLSLRHIGRIQQTLQRRDQGWRGQGR